MLFTRKTTPHCPLHRVNTQFLARCFPQGTPEHHFFDHEGERLQPLLLHRMISIFLQKFELHRGQARSDKVGACPALFLSSSPQPVGGDPSVEFVMGEASGVWSNDEDTKIRMDAR